MIILITGASHTGKTLLAQQMLGKFKYPYLSIEYIDGFQNVGEQVVQINTDYEQTIRTIMSAIKKTPSFC